MYKQPAWQFESKKAFRTEKVEVLAPAWRRMHVKPVFH